MEFANPTIKIEIRDLSELKRQRSSGSFTLLRDPLFNQSPCSIRRNVSTGNLQYLQVPTPTGSPRSSPGLVRARQRITRLLNFRMGGEGCGAEVKDHSPTLHSPNPSIVSHKKTVSFKQTHTLGGGAGAGVYTKAEENEMYRELLRCVIEDDCKTLKAILKRKLIDVNTKGENSSTLMHQAAFKGCVKCVKTLIKYGSDVNATDNEGWGPLHASIFSRQLPVVKMLLDNYSRVDVLSSSGWSPLHLSVYLNDLYITHELVQHGADTMLNNSYGVSPFQLAINLDKSLIFQYFLQLSCFLLK